MESWIPLVLGYLFIFSARVVDMSLDVIRILMLTRDRRLLAAAIGFAEVSVFILALNQVLVGGLSDPLKIIAYAGGFATGNYVGSLIDSKMALGFLSLQIFPKKDKVKEIIEGLRSQGFGVTSVQGQGRDGDRIILFVNLKRKDLDRALDLLECIQPGAFYHISDTRGIRGGVFPGKKKCV